MDQSGTRASRWKYAGSSFKGGSDDLAEASGFEFRHETGATSFQGELSSVRARVQQLDVGLQEEASTSSMGRTASRTHSRGFSFDSSVPKSVVLDGREHHAGEDPSLAHLEREVVLLKEQIGALEKENRRWKQRVNSLQVGGNQAVAAIVREVVDENTRLMVTIGEISQQNEELRRSVDIAAIDKTRNGVQPSESADLPSASSHALTTLQQQNQQLAKENDLLKRGIGERSSVLDQVDLTLLPEEAAFEFVKLMTENEDLKDRLNELYEVKVNVIDGENVALVHQLTDENVRLETEIQRLHEKLSEASEGSATAQANLDVVENMKTEVQRLKEEKQKVMDANVKLTEKNSRLVQENEQLEEAAARASPSAEAGPTQDDNIEIVRELTDENRKLIEDMKMSSGRVLEVMAVNTQLLKKARELEERLFRVAFEDVGESFEGGDSSISPSPSLQTESDDLGRRAKDLEAQIKQAEEDQKQAMVRRMKLQAKSMRVVQRHDERQVLQSRGAPPTAAPDAPETARKREERDMARAALQSVIEENRKKREQEIRRKQEEAVRKMREQENEKRLEEELKARYKRDAEDKVRKAYFHYAGKEDVGGFMRFLGYKFALEVSENASDEELREAFKKAIIMTHPDRHVNGTMEKQALAEAAYTKLQRWMGEVGV